MIVYIEYVIIDNLVMNSLIIYFTLKIMRFKISKLKVFLTAVLGTAVAVLLPLLTMPAALTVIIKFLTGFILTIFIARYKNFLQYIKTTGFFFGITFIMGGSCFGLLYLIEGDIQKAITMGYEKIPVGLIAGAIITVVFVISCAIKHLKKLKVKAPYYYKVKLYLNGRNIETVGYMDSGNLLYDFSGKPVVVANYDAVGALIADNILAGKKTKLEKIEFKTVSGTDSMKVFSPDKMEVYSDGSVNILYDVTVGITERQFGDYSILLHPACV